LREPLHSDGETLFPKNRICSYHIGFIAIRFCLCVNFNVFFVPCYDVAKLHV